jgi:hypothetical protein
MDCDAAGRGLGQRVKQTIRRARVFDLGLAEHEDVSDFFKYGFNGDDLRNLAEISAKGRVFA